MISFNVNGAQQNLEIDPDMPLLWVLRDILGLTGTKYGCGQALCGACTVHLDGHAVRSCVTPVRRVDGKSVTSIEGLSPDGTHPLQKAWVEQGVPQCGFCQAGQIMSAAALLEKNPAPSVEDIEKSLSGNLCRCGAYNRIRDAVRSCSALKSASADGVKP